MANENQNTGPQNLGSKGQDTKTLREGLKALLEDQGDFNNLLKTAISDLRKMDSAYGRIESRLSSLNKDAINVKQINQELLRLRQKEFLETKRLQEYTKSSTQESRNALNLAKQRTNELVQMGIALGEQVNYEETMLAYLRDAGNLEAVQLYTQEKQVEIAKEQTQIGQEQLDIEKQLNKEIGISGKLFQGLAQKLGVGNEYYSQMVLRARQLNAEGKKISFFDKLGFLTKAAAGGVVEALTDPLTAIPLIAGGVATLVSGLKSALDYILGIQDKTVKFARAMNLSTGAARQIKMDFASLSISSGDLFINSQKMVESQMELVEALGVTNRLSNEQLATNIKLKDITGLDLETRRGIVEVSTITGRSSESITKSVIAQVVGLKQATGVSFQYQKILKEASNLGGYLGLSFAKYPAQLTKSLLTVKAMGMELKQLDSLADSFLDFESSISKEFEAQLLTGRDINLAKAREAFLNNDLATAASEITRQVGSANDFLKLNRIQAESLASAFGMSRDQMGEMLKQQELLATLGAKQGDSAREQLRLGLEKYKNQKALAAAVGEEAYQSLVNASAQEKIAAFIDKIKQSIADFVESSGIIGKIESFIESISSPDKIKSIINTLKGFFASAVETVLTITNGIIDAIDFITFGFGIDETFERKFEQFAAQAPAKIRALGGDFGSVNVGGNVARRDNSNSASQAQDNMMMSRPAQPVILENRMNVNVVDTPNSAQSRYQRNVSFDNQTP
jgi:hypothetical protein